MARFVFRGSVGIASVTVLAAASAAWADAFFADNVVSYTPAGVSASYQNQSAALGKPSSQSYGGDLTPFNPAFDGSDLLGIGTNGSVTLHLAQTAGAMGTTIGIHTGVGLEDDDYPNGTISGSASTFTNPRTSDLQVSQDGTNWVDVGTMEFALPTNYYSQGVTTPGYQTDPGTQEADWAKPFAPLVTGNPPPPLYSAFDNQDWNGVLSVLNGSAGGQWPTISAPTLGGINYVRFNVPGDNTYPMYVDAVVGNTGDVSITTSYTLDLAHPVVEDTYGTIITNSGTLDIAADVDLLTSSVNSASALINTGIVRKSAAFGTSNIWPAVYDDQGSFDVQSGTVTLRGRLIIPAGSSMTKTGAGALRIAGNQYHGSGAVLHASAGTTEFATDAGGGAGANLTIDAQAAVSLQSTQHLAGLNVGTSGVVTVSTGGNKTVYTTSLGISGSGKLDLNDNDVVVDYSGASPITTLRQYVADGHSGTHGIVSTAGSNWNSSTTLALIDNNDPLVNGAYAQWPPGSGQTIDATTVFGKYTFIGDVDLDGQVGTSDYLILDTNRGASELSLGGSWIKGDVDGDGKVGTSDYLLLDTYRGSGAANPLIPRQSPGGTSATAIVPEPSALAGLLGAGLLVARQRARRRIPR